VTARCQHFGVELARFVRIAEPLVRLRAQPQDEWIRLIRFRELGRGRAEIPGVEGEVAGQIRILRRLVGVRAFVQNRLCRGRVRPRFVVTPAPGRDPRLRVMPAKVPQVALVRRHLLDEPRGLVAGAVPLFRFLDLA
jgi:hypothetical protein